MGWCSVLSRRVSTWVSLVKINTRVCVVERDRILRLIPILIFGD